MHGTETKKYGKIKTKTTIPRLVNVFSYLLEQKLKVCILTDAANDGLLTFEKAVSLSAGVC